MGRAKPPEQYDTMRSSEATAYVAPRHPYRTSTLLHVCTGMAPQPSRRLRLADIHQPWVKCTVGEAGRHLRGLQGGGAGVEDPAEVVAVCVQPSGIGGRRTGHACGTHTWCPCLAGLHAASRQPLHSTKCSTHIGSRKYGRLVLLQVDWVHAAWLCHRMGLGAANHVLLGTAGRPHATCCPPSL